MQNKYIPLFLIIIQPYYIEFSHKSLLSMMVSMYSYSTQSNLLIIDILICISIFQFIIS